MYFNWTNLMISTSYCHSWYCLLFAWIKSI
jgi:hypothetical protein